MVYLCFFSLICPFTVSPQRLLFKCSPFVFHGRNPCRFVTAYEGEKIIKMFSCQLFFFSITTDVHKVTYYMDVLAALTILDILSEFT